jgi:integrase
MGRAVKRAGLSHLTPHGLRHTFATEALEAGVDVVFVSKLLGHSSTSVTQAIYQHAREEPTADAARAIATALLGEQ